LGGACRAVGAPVEFRPTWQASTADRVLAPETSVAGSGASLRDDASASPASARDGSQVGEGGWLAVAGRGRRVRRQGRGRLTVRPAASKYGLLGREALDPGPGCQRSASGGRSGDWPRAASVGPVSDDRQRIDLTQDEDRLRDTYAHLPERAVADSATSSLAVVIKRTESSGWAKGSPEEYRRRAIVLLAVRLLRAIRAGTAVYAAVWELEGRAMDRLVLEIRARCSEVVNDPSDETARRWLERRPTSDIGASIRTSAPDIDPADVNTLYLGLSQAGHADPAGIFTWLTTHEGDTGAAITWGPRCTIETRRSLLMYATLAAEMATLLAGEAGAEHPNSDALADQLAQAAALFGDADGRG